MKILITGATGFIGTNIIQKLYKKYNFTALVRSTSNISAIKDCCHTHCYSDLEDLVQFCKKEKFTIVIHLATLLANSGHSMANIHNIIKSNITFGVEILEATKQSNIPFFINTSSTTLYCNSNDYNPSSFYASTKKAFEDIMKYYALTSNTIFTNILLFNVFGSYDNKQSLFSLLHKVSENSETFQMSEGNQIVDYSHVYDIVDAYDLLIGLIQKNPKFCKDKIFSLKGDERKTLREVVSIYEEVLGKKLNIHWGTRPKRELEIMQPWEGGEQLPDWRRKISLREGFKML